MDTDVMLGYVEDACHIDFDAGPARRAPRRCCASSENRENRSSGWLSVQKLGHQHAVESC